MDGTPSIQSKPRFSLISLNIARPHIIGLWMAGQNSGLALALLDVRLQEPTESCLTLVLDERALDSRL